VGPSSTGWRGKAPAPRADLGPTQHAVFMKFLIESLTADAELVGGAEPVVVVLHQRLPDDLALDLVLVLGEGAETGIGLDVRGGGGDGGSGCRPELLERSGEVGKADDRPLAEGNGPLDHVAELADIAGPGVGLEHPDGLVGDPGKLPAVRGGKLLDE